MAWDKRYPPKIHRKDGNRMWLVLVHARTGHCKLKNGSKQMQWGKGMDVPGASAKRLSCVTVGCVLRGISTTTEARGGPRKLWVSGGNELSVSEAILTDRRQASPAPRTDLTGLMAVRL